MSSDIMEKLTSIADVTNVRINKVEVHGERATEVVAVLSDGRTVTGTFTSEDKTAFGGVDFSSRKDVGALMSSKIKSVLAGTSPL